MDDSCYEITDLVRLVISESADKLSLYVGQPPVLYVAGEAHTVEGPFVRYPNALSMVRKLIGTRQMRELQEQGLINFIYKVRGKANFRGQARLVNEEIQLELHRV